MNINQLLNALKSIKKFNLTINCTEYNIEHTLSNSGTYIKASDLEQLIEEAEQIIYSDHDQNLYAGTNLEYYNTLSTELIKFEIKRAEEIGDYDLVVDLKQIILERNMK